MDKKRRRVTHFVSQSTENGIATATDQVNYTENMETSRMQQVRILDTSSSDTEKGIRDSVYLGARLFAVPSGGCIRSLP